MIELQPVVDVVRPMPTSQTFHVDPFKLPDGQAICALRIFSATGEAVYFITADQADQIAASLAGIAQVARGIAPAIAIATPDQLRQLGNGHKPGELR